MMVLILKRLGLTIAICTIWLHLVDATASSPVTCTSPGVECEYTEENYIDTETEVQTEEECRQICMDQAITFTRITPMSFLL